MRPRRCWLASFATFSIAFVARPFGAIVFGHFGDRIGRKATLTAALQTPGDLDRHHLSFANRCPDRSRGACALLALCRSGQGFGLGGEWCGAVMLATENVPEGKRSWYGMFPHLSAPVGLFLSSGSMARSSSADDPAGGQGRGRGRAAAVPGGGTVLIGVSSFLLAPLMGGSDAALDGLVTFGMFLMGLTYGVIAAAPAVPFPTRLR